MLAVLLGVLPFVLHKTINHTLTAATLIPTENSLPGDPNWTALNNTANAIPNDANSHALEGYASEVSLYPGASANFRVSVANGQRYRILIYRLGWYNGTGARQITCLPSCTTDKTGITQPINQLDPTTGYLNPNWSVTDTYTFSPQAISGYYIAKLVMTTGTLAGKSTNIPIILKAPLGQNSAILVQAPLNTWQAYNPWGGKSLYGFNSTGGTQAYKISVDRPYAISQAVFFSNKTNYEIPLIQFLEKEGYDVSYTTDIDLHRDSAEFLKHRLVISNGHDEYWTKTMFYNFQAARDAGVNLAFIGGNQVDSQIRYEDNERTIVLYRLANLDPNPDPSLKTVQFFNLVPPLYVCSLLGVQSYNGAVAGPTDPPRNFTINSSVLSDPWFANTGFSAGAILAGAVGYEWSAVNLTNCPIPSLTTFFHYTNGTGRIYEMSDIIRYQAPSGAKVFASGSLGVVNALASDTRMQQFFRNALNDLTSGTGSTSSVPVNISPPVISGNPQVGQTYISTPGTWNAVPSPSYTYQWQSCQSGTCSDLAGATGATYTVAASDLGKVLQLSVTATNLAGSLTVASAQTTMVTTQLTNLAPNPDFEVIPQPSYNGSFYPTTSTPVPAFSWATDAFRSGGYSLKIATATNYNGQLSRWSSTISQGVIAGHSYSTSIWIKSSTLNDKALINLRFFSSAGASLATLASPGVLGTSDWTQVTVTGTAPSGSSSIILEFILYGRGTAWGDDITLVDQSAAPPAPTAPTNASAPGITGIPQVGQILTTTSGTWSGSPTPTYSYQWQACSAGACSNIAAATSNSYGPSVGDVGKTLRVSVTASNSAGSSVANSAQTALVSNIPAATPPTNTSLPQISGNYQSGQVLSASPGTWNGTPAPTFAYQWQSCQSGVCGDIAGATNSGYTLSVNDVNKTIRVLVTATNSAGSASALSSQSTPVTDSLATVFNNLAPNPDFETNPSSTYFNYTDGAATFTWATDQAHSGTHSLKTVATSGSLSRWMSQTYLIAVTPTKTYTVSAWLKTAGATSANITSTFWGNSGFTGAAPSSTSISGTQNWTPISYQVTAPASATAVRLEFRLSGTGTLWADDVVLQQQ